MSMRASTDAIANSPAMRGRCHATKKTALVQQKNASNRSFSDTIAWLIGKHQRAGKDPVLARRSHRYPEENRDSWDECRVDLRPWCGASRHARRTTDVPFRERFVEQAASDIFLG